MNSPSTLKETQEFFYRLCGDHPFDYDAITRALTPQVGNHLRQIPQERQLVYRDLVYTSTHDLLHSAMPVFFAILGEAASEELIRQFLHIAKPNSRYYRDIPKAFMAYLQKESPSLPHPAFFELADYEYEDYALLFRDNVQQPTHNLARTLDEAVAVLNPNLTHRTYSYPVHTIDKTSDLTAISPCLTTLVLSRNPITFKIETTTLTAPEHQLLLRLLNHPDLALEKHLHALVSDEEAAAAQTQTMTFLGALRTFLDKKIVIAMV